MTNKTLLISFYIICTLFIVSGLSDIVNSVWVYMTEKRIHVFGGIFNLAAGIGMLRLRKGWRIYSLVVLALLLILLPMLIFFLREGVPLKIRFFSLELESASLWTNAAAAALIFIICLWQFCILMHSDIKKMFSRGSYRE